MSDGSVHSNVHPSRMTLEHFFLSLFNLVNQEVATGFISYEPMFIQCIFHLLPTNNMYVVFPKTRPPFIHIVPLKTSYLERRCWGMEIKVSLTADKVILMSLPQYMFLFVSTSLVNDENNVFFVVICCVHLQFGKLVEVWLYTEKELKYRSQFLMNLRLAELKWIDAFFQRSLI